MDGRRQTGPPESANLAPKTPMAEESDREQVDHGPDDGGAPSPGGKGELPGEKPGSGTGSAGETGPTASLVPAMDREPETVRDEALFEGSDPDPGPGRRQFLQKAGSVVVGGAIVACPAAVGLFAVSAPVRRASKGGVVVRLTALDALPEDGTPQIFKVVADKVDAWTTHKDLPLGLVFASRGSDGSVTVFSASCPHAGCAVEYRKDQELGKHYYCPCHESYFGIDGSIGNEDSPATRGLDSLELDEEKLADGEVWIRFQKFKAGVAEKKPVS
jgi:menaquinol-cytochrome c reductase iron-sulfur subunit